MRRVPRVVLRCVRRGMRHALPRACWRARSQDDATTAGASAAEASKEKLEWKDVFELTEWFRPGTIKRAADFDPTKM